MKLTNQKEKKKLLKKRVKKWNYFNSGLNWSNSDHVFWPKYSLFGQKLDQYKNQKKNLKKRKWAIIRPKWLI